MVDEAIILKSLSVFSQEAADVVRVTTGVTGDPHLFWQPMNSSLTVETCEAAGHQLYLQNLYVVINGTNTHVDNQANGPAGRATVLTQVRQVELLF